MTPREGGTLLVEPTGTTCTGKLRFESMPVLPVTVTATPAEGKRTLRAEFASVGR